MRLPNVYYTNQFFYGVTEPMGKPAPLEKYIGESLEFDIYLNKDNTPILTAQWDITALIKSSPASTNPTWSGELYNGIYENNKQGYYKILIPAEQTKNWLAGTYWMDIIVHEKVAASKRITDELTILARIPICMDYANSSQFKDPIKEQPEQTLPHKVDIKQL